MAASTEKHLGAAREGARGVIIRVVTLSDLINYVRNYFHRIQNKNFVNVAFLTGLLSREGQ